MWLLGKLIFFEFADLQLKTGSSACAENQATASASANGFSWKATKKGGLVCYLNAQLQELLEKKFATEREALVAEFER